VLVCHCHRVCDRTVRECIRDGASSVDEVGRACGAGTGCGGCQPTIAGLLAEPGRDDLGARRQRLIVVTDRPAVSLAS
jgi:bacterioferritin-associated ferredoxin